MEIEVCLDVGLGIAKTAIHDFDRFAHGAKKLLLDSFSRQGGNVRLQHQSQLSQVRRAFLLVDADHQIERLPNSLRGSVGDKGSAAGICLHETFLPQCFHSLPYGSTTYAETLGKVALRRQLISRLELTFENGIFHLLNNLLKEAIGFDGAIHCFKSYRIYYFIRHPAFNLDETLHRGIVI